MEQRGSPGGRRDTRQVPPHRGASCLQDLVASGPRTAKPLHPTATAEPSGRAGTRGGRALEHHPHVPLEAAQTEADFPDDLQKRGAKA